MISIMKSIVHTFLYIWDSVTKCAMIRSIKRFMALVLLKYILGWSIDKTYDEYKLLRNGKHIVTYTHTGDYETIIGCLLAHAYDLPFVVIAKDELGKIPIISNLFSLLSHMIFIDRKSNVSATSFIANHLKTKSNFVLLIAPEGSRKRVDDIKSGFYHIALETESDIYHVAVDFENHIITTSCIANNAIVQTSSYTKIKILVENEMKKDKPYHPERCHLVNPTKICRTSLFNTNNSILIYIPPIIVLIVMVSVLINVYYLW